MERAAKAPGAVQHSRNAQDRVNAALSVNPEADALIREVMIKQNHGRAQGGLSSGATALDQDAAQTIKHPRRRSGTSTLPEGAPRVSSGSGLVGSIKTASALLPANRPSKKLVLALVVLVVMVLRPLLIPLTLLLLFLVVLIAYFSLGPDRVAEMVVSNWKRLNAWRPEQAELLRQKAEDMAMRIDAYLDRLPGTWTEQVHVPDFSKPDRSVEELPDPFERLAKDTQRG